MKIQILPSALKDLNKGKAFYELQEQGLGDYFQSSLSSDIDSLMLYAGIHRSVYGYHRLLSARFPYAIYYTTEAQGHILIWRILDMRENTSDLGQKLP